MPAVIGIDVNYILSITFVVGRTTRKSSRKSFYFPFTPLLRLQHVQEIPSHNCERASVLRSQKLFTAVQELKKKRGGFPVVPHTTNVVIVTGCGVRALGAFGASTLLHPWVGFASVGVGALVVFGCALVNVIITMSTLSVQYI